MAIMPAFVISVLAVTANLTVALIAFLTGQDVMVPVLSALQTIGNGCLFMLFIGAVTTLSEWKNIHCPAWKKVLYTFTFPLFMLTYIPISMCAVFQKVEWKPIEHKVAVSLDDLRRR